MTIPEDPKQHVVRYLKTITIPMATAKFLVHYCRKLTPFSPDLKAYIISATPLTPNVTTAHVQTFRDRFLAHFSLPEEVKEHIRSAISRVEADRRYNGSLHAEAIIMALAHSVQSGAVSNAALPLSHVKPVFEVRFVVICIASRC